MKEIDLSEVFKLIEGALEKEDYATAGKYLFPAMDQFDDNAQLLFYASHLYVREGRYLAGYLHAKRSMDLAPNGHTAANLGATSRRLNRIEESQYWLKKAIDYDDRNVHAWNNLAAVYVNEGNPWPGIEYANKALELDPKFDKARWNRGLLKLEAGNFAEGWEDYRAGLTTGERASRTYYPENPELEPRMLETRDELLQFGRRPRVVVWGEQGIGDEIMFSTILRDMAVDADVIFDCHPRLIDIMKESYVDCVVDFHPTRKILTHESRPPLDWVKDVPQIDFKCSMGDLGRFYRRDYQSFRKTNMKFLWADEDLTKRYWEELHQLANGRVKVGFAYTGGIINTMRWYRSIDPMLLAPVLTSKDVLPVSLQYEDEGPTLRAFNEKFGRPYMSFPAVTQAHNYMHTAAMVAALDVVVTVCQSVAHLAAAMDKPTYVLVPGKPAWRYGVGGGDRESDELWYFYSDKAKLLRMKDGKWDAPLARLSELLRDEHGVEI